MVPMLLTLCGCNPALLLQSSCYLPHCGLHTQSDGWLQASTSALVSCWKNLPRNSHTRFLSASASYQQQECWGLIYTDKMDPQVCCSQDGPSFSLCSILLLLFFLILVFPLDRNISGLKLLRSVSGLISRLWAMPFYWRWSLQVRSLLHCAF